MPNRWFVPFLPDHEDFGYTSPYLATQMDEKTHERFWEWMHGQTCMLIEGNITVVYGWDLERFYAGLSPLD